MMNRKLIIAGVFIAAIFVASCTKQIVHRADPSGETALPDTIIVTPFPSVSDTVTSGDNNNMRLGNPTMAKPDSALSENYLINQVYYIEAYSRSRGVPTWVSWHFQSEDKGSIKRQDDFRAFAGLPGSWYRVSETSYNYDVNAFDRGHNCPSGDRTSSYAANSSTFYMTNMIPQAPYLNQGPWAELEDNMRDVLVGANNEAYVIMGSYGIGGLGRGKTDTAKTIDNGRVTVPKKVWKVAVIIPKGSNDLDRIDANTTILAVNMPNCDNLYSTSGTGRTAWKNYLTTVADIEADAKLHGVNLDILSNVSTTIKAALKAKKYIP
jgi:endonuclease G